MVLFQNTPNTNRGSSIFIECRYNNCDVYEIEGSKKICHANYQRNFKQIRANENFLDRRHCFIHTHVLLIPPRIKGKGDTHSGFGCLEDPGSVNFLQRTLQYDKAVIFKRSNQSGLRNARSFHVPPAFRETTSIHFLPKQDTHK